VSSDAVDGHDMPRGNRLGEFLRARRALVVPTDVGLPYGRRRRVHGLRREELAQLAGVSLDYYARLEQGRQPTASVAVLDAVARALRLNEDERRYLHNLAQVGHVAPGGVGNTAPAARQRIPPLMRVFGRTPAILCDRHLDVVAANPAACFLFDDFPAMPVPERNSVRWILLSPRAKLLYGEEWESASSEMIGMLRLNASADKDVRLQQIVAELNEKSELFRSRWAQHQVSKWQHETKTLNIPDAGPLEFANMFMSVEGTGGQTLALVVPRDPVAFEAAFARLWQSVESTEGELDG
jgi:transcriptional regulator with XRE-family HTH domain